MQETLSIIHTVASAFLSSPHGVGELVLGLIFAAVLLAFPLLGRDHEHHESHRWAHHRLTWRR